MIQSSLTDAYRVAALNGVHQPDDEYRMALYDPTAELGPATSAYTPRGECEGEGYTAGGAVLTGRRVRLWHGIACLDWDAPSWDPATISADGFLIYNASIEGNPSVMVVAFDRVYQATNGPFTPMMPASGHDSSLIQWPDGLAQQSAPAATED